MNQQEKELIYNFIHKHELAALATVDKTGKPEVAMVEFGDSPELEIIFDTLHPSYWKYENIKNNNAVALAIGWENNITVQYEGLAIEIEGEEKDRCKKIYFTKNPIAEKWDSHPEIKYFKVMPRWIRYSDYSVKPYKIIELNF